MNFAVYKCNASDDLLNLVFDEEMLMTGKKSKSATLQERYTAERKKQLAKNSEKAQDTPKKRKKKSKRLQWKSMRSILRLRKEKNPKTRLKSQCSEKSQKQYLLV